jgi:arylsulfatase A-like enzyme
MSSRSVLPLLLSAMIAAAPVPPPIAAASSPPNIVFILTDDLDVGSLDRLPRLRSLLADTGTSFSSFFSARLCAARPARRSCAGSTITIITSSGTSPPKEVPEFLDLDTRARTSRRLHAAGYRTGFSVSQPLSRPGDRTHVPPGWDEWDSPSGGTPFNELGYELNENGTLVSYDATQANYLTDVLAGKAVRFIQQSAPDARPFFLYVATLAPHLPATPPVRYRKDFGDRARTRSFDEKDGHRQTRVARHRRSARGHSRLDGSIAGAFSRWRPSRTCLERDRAVRFGQARGHLHLFSSDNGSIWDSTAWCRAKQMPYEGDIRLLIVQVRRSAVLVRNELAGNVDLTATFADLAGSLCRHPDGLPPCASKGDPRPRIAHRVAARHTQHSTASTGVSGSGPRSRTSGPPVLRVLRVGAAHPRVPSFKGLRTADALYVEYADGEQELYDLRADPAELVNIAATADRSRLAALSMRLAATARCAGDTCRTADAAGP